MATEQFISVPLHDEYGFDFSHSILHMPVVVTGGRVVRITFSDITYIIGYFDISGKEAHTCLYCPIRCSPGVCYCGRFIPLSSTQDMTISPHDSPRMRSTPTRPIGFPDESHHAVVHYRGFHPWRLGQYAPHPASCSGTYLSGWLCSILGVFGYFAACTVSHDFLT